MGSSAFSDSTQVASRRAEALKPWITNPGCTTIGGHRDISINTLRVGRSLGVCMEVELVSRGVFWRIGTKNIMNSM